MNYAPHWDIFHRYQSAKAIAETLDLLPKNWNFTPIGDRKAPYRDNWQNEELAREHIKKCLLHGEEVISKKTGKPYHRYSSGYGLLTGEQSGGLLAIDFDGASAALVWEAIAQGNETPLTVSWTSGKPGRKQLLFQVPEHIREKLREHDFHRAVVTEFNEVKTARHTETVKGKEVEKIDDLLEFRYSNHQSVLPPSYHPDTGFYKWINSPFDVPVALLPEWLCEILINLAKREKQLTEEKLANKQNKERKNQHKPNSYSPSFSNDNNWTEEDWARSYLAAIHPSRFDSYDDWLRIGMACNSVSDNLLYDWDKASQQSSKYKPGECDRKWQSFGNCSSVTIGTLYHYAVADGWVNPLKRLGWIYRDDNSAKKTQTISKEQWENLKAVHSFKDILNELLDAEVKKKNECLAIVPIKSVGFIHYLPGFLPDYQTYLEWEKPLIYFSKGEQNQLVAEMVRKGYPRILISTLMGFAKSHQSGELNRDELGLIAYDDEGNDLGGRLLYISQSKDNPSTPTLENNFPPLIDRHDGKKEIYDKPLPSGKPSRRRIKPGETPDIEENCGESETFNEAAKIGVPILGGPNEPICGRCNKLATCVFLKERKRQIEAEKQLSINLTQFFGVDVTKDVGIVDEPSISLETEKTLTLGISKLIQSVYKLKKEHKETYDYFAWLIEFFIDALEDLKAAGVPQYGLTHLGFMDYLAKRVNKEFGEINEHDILAWKFLKQHNEHINHPLLNQLNYAAYVQSQNKLWETSDEEIDPWKLPTLKQLREELEDKLTNNWDEILKGKQTPQEKQEAIREYGVFNSLKYIIDGLLGKCDLSVNPAGQLVVKGQNWLVRKTLKNFKSLIMLEKISRSDLERKLGIRDFAEIREIVPPDSFKNLKIIFVKGMGQCGKIQIGQKMRDTGVDRLLAGVRSLVKKNKKAGLITYSNTLDLFDPIKDLFAVTGWWFNHSRGTNIYKDCDQLILHGRPISNVNSQKGNYHLQTGKLAVGNNEKYFWAYHYRQMLEETKQAIGRVRAHLRPDQQIEVIILAGDAFSDDQIRDIQKEFPGCQTEIRQIAETCNEAAKKGVRTDNNIIKAAWEIIQSGGKATIDAVAKAIDRTKGCVSQRVDKLPITGGFKALVKSLVLLYRALKAKLNFLELDENAQFCLSVLKDCVDGFEAGEVSAEVLAEVVQQQLDMDGYNPTFAALTALPRRSLRVLFRALFGLALDTIAIDTSPPEPIPIAA